MSNSKFPDRIEEGDESKVPLDKLFDTKKLPTCPPEIRNPRPRCLPKDQPLSSFRRYPYHKKGGKHIRQGYGIRKISGRQSLCVKQ